MKYTWLSLVLMICMSGQTVNAQQFQATAHTEAAITEHAQQRMHLVDFKQMKKTENRPIVAVVLGSGGARGYAHIGVLQVLEQAGVKPDFIVGTSAGSIVGAIYASGKNADELRDIALNMKPNDVRDVTIAKKGFLEGLKVEEFVNKQVNQTPLQDLPIPMYVVATELQHGKRTVFNYGDTGQAVRASVAIPSMFIPTKIADEEYVDGGLVSPVPVDVARELGADIVIAVDILAQPQHTETNNVWGLFNQNINIMQNHLAKQELQHADVVIQPDIREKAHIFDVKGRESTMQAGMDAATAQMNQLVRVYQQKKFPKPLLLQAQQLSFPSMNSQQ
jgi:NTE family protein